MLFLVGPWGECIHSGSLQSDSSWRTAVQKWIPIHHGEHKHEEENKDIPSRRSGRAIGPARATATRDKKATSVNCISAICIEGANMYI
jgi:hypothetical protein